METQALELAHQVDFSFWPLWLFEGTIDALKQETNKYAITNVLFHHIGNDMPKRVGQA